MVTSSVQVGTLAEAYGLRTYHVTHSLLAASKIPLSGKRVLEVGGCLPDAYVKTVLGAEQWVGVQELGYFREIGAPDQHTAAQQVLPITAVSTACELESYAVLLGAVEDLPACLHGAFDAVVSFAAFEHILRLGPALDAMAAALMPEGRLYSLFAPIWSSPTGHHLPDMRSADGTAYGFGDSPIPPWGHLLMRPPELYHYLLKHTDERTAGDMVYFTYHSPHINRLFIEDYIYYVANSPLTGSIRRAFPSNPSDKTQQRLESLHPGRTKFDGFGLEMILGRRADNAEAGSETVTG